MIPNQDILSVPVTCLPFEEQIMLIVRWAKIRDSKVVCLANIHMIMEAYRNYSFKKVLHQANLVTADGKPLVWMLRRLGILHQNQVAGVDVFLNLCDLAENTGIPIYFIGSTEDILKKIKQKLDQDYPILKVAGMKSIPLMSIDETRHGQDKELIEEINESGAGIIFVCLKSPKQEIWMSQYRGRIKGVLIEVGAVFSMYAGITPIPPYLIQHSGWKWLSRLLQELSRLWHRYISTISPFMYLVILQLLILYQEKFSKVSLQLKERNVELDMETLDFAPEKLGEILVRQNVITRKELTEAISQKRLEPSLKIGEILVRSNLISLSQLKFYLKNQNIKLGQLLLERKIIKQNSLNDALYLQNNTNNKLGEILVHQELITEDKLKEFLIEQYIRHKGLFLIDKTSNNNLDFALEFV
ncbi:MAG: WecB/TagA/CpsF family glycosyltransferase [Xenococcus sp. MO_188.B8]|nr:WecB/TagA/CpsF family glycosyltransferase [Xenococcus sp. MO_188.B8]